MTNHHVLVTPEDSHPSVTDHERSASENPRRKDYCPAECWLALTLSACGADNDPDVEKFDEYEDEQAPDTQNNDDTIQDEDADTQDEE